MRTREFTVDVKMTLEYIGVITLRAGSQEEADAPALDEFEAHASRASDAGKPVRLPPPWRKHSGSFGAVEASMIGRSVDCGKETTDFRVEYYMVSDQPRAASAGGGMLCLACLKKRIGRPLALEDFTTMAPEREAWARHVRARESRF